ncbi:ABC transporter ATP-binding protein [Arenicella chitinivorans]|uniref:Probable ATP-binding protein YheS n=1 Tax=Arenicella chitinivorans TaxID=1329800 RepID=A0A918RID2_9GAMM|nr:ATP-binding cassette domain-containing protein [Arenicella chitinivorans]GGZ98986.1 ABC transporter ATP-binding protein [Arenicella chitinivorans]
MIQFENLSIRRGESLLFDNMSCQIHPGQKVGLTGANGCGKSSLFAVLRNELVIDKGDVKIPRDWVMAHVAQEAPANERPAIEHVLDGDQEWRELDAKVQDPDHPRFLNFQARYEEIDGYSARARAAQLLDGLGFKPEDIDKPAKTFSGGWRVRLNVAKALMCRSDLLLLDEPTNHLDLDAVLWLERWLKQYRGTLILIAHDRDFLDELTTHTLHIENQRASLFKGNYSAFERIRTEQLANQQSQYEKQQREVLHMQDFVRRFRAKASKATQAQSRLKALEKMQQIAPAHVDSPFGFSIPDPEKNPSPLLSLHKASVGYADTPIVNGIEFAMAPGDRVGLIGPNGAGKSTLIKLLAGELKLLSGNYHASKEINIGYFAQHQIEQLQMAHSPMEHLALLDKECNNGQATDNQLRRYLGSFGFTGSKATSKVAPFSGGEKSRLALALICYQRPNLLLLDEPTNHLDLEMRQALAVALQDFSGAVVLVSHDRHLLKVNSDKLILVANGRATEFQGSVDDYPKWLAEHNRGDRGQSAQGDEKPRPTNTAAAKKEQKRLDAERRKELQPLSNKIKRAERVIEKLTEQKEAIEAQLADTELYNDDNKDKLKALLTDQAYVQKELDQAETDWMTFSEKHELLSLQLRESA